MYVTKNDFIENNEITNKKGSLEEFDYFKAVIANAKVGSNDDGISKAEYISSRLAFGLSKCDKLQTSNNYEAFLKHSPMMCDVAMVMKFVPDSISYLGSYFKIPKDKPMEIMEILRKDPSLINYEIFNNLASIPNQGYNATELFINYPTIQTLEGLQIWLKSKPTIVHIEKVMSKVNVARHKLIIKLYLSIKVDKTYSPIIMEVAKETNSEDMLIGYTLDSRW